MLTVARRRGFIVLSTLACIVALMLSRSPAASGRVQTEDRNHDGRPDVWRTYDAGGKLRYVAIDTNFDGQPDREERYQRGMLVRRETDRDFDRHTDLIEEFDSVTQQHVRSIADLNRDGVADLLVLFKDGQPIHSAWADANSPAPNATVARPGPGRLVPLGDPFTATAAFQAQSPDPSIEELAVSVIAVVVDVPTHSWTMPRQTATREATAPALMAVALAAPAPRGPPPLV